MSEADRQQIVDCMDVYEEAYFAGELPIIFYKGIPDGVVETYDEIIIQGDIFLSKRNPADLRIAYDLAVKYYGDGSIVDSRSLYYKEARRWKSKKVDKKTYNGVVEYTFKGVKSEDNEKEIIGNDKIQVQKIMNEIEKNTNIKFREDTKWSRWDAFRYRLGFIKVVKIHIDNDAINDGYAGLATVGRSSLAICKFSPNIFQKDSEGNYNAKRLETVYHELGHNLGLAHEFDRPDESKYIRWYNQEMKKKYSSSLSASSFATVGSFDYSSIMNYNGMYYRNDTNRLLYRSLTFSSGDYKIINTMY